LLIRAAGRLAACYSASSQRVAGHFRLVRPRAFKPKWLSGSADYLWPLCGCNFVADIEDKRKGHRCQCYAKIFNKYGIS
jgi:hypothetical protein